MQESNQDKPARIAIPSAIPKALPKASKSGAASLGKLALIGLLMALLLIPVSMIESVITERDGSREVAEKEVAGKWGESQQVAGPILTVPYRVYVKGDKGKVDTILNYAHFLP